MALVDVGKVAKFLNLDERRIQQLVQEGMPREKRGQYDLTRCTHWYVRYLQSALEKTGQRSDGTNLSERDERVRLLSAEADLKEIQLAKERGQLVTIVDVEKEMSELVLTTKARVLAVPPRVAPELVGENSRVMIQARIEKSLKDALLQLEKAYGVHATNSNDA
jgi:phage terminase Nu1 subunit (DNA packaging protein)